MCLDLIVVDFVEELDLRFIFVVYNKVVYSINHSIFGCYHVEQTAMCMTGFRGVCWCVFLFSKFFYFDKV